MLLAGVFGLLVGLGLGNRFRVLVLVPAHGLGCLVAIASWMAGSAGGSLLGGLAVASLGCNLGYVLAGIVSGLGRRRVARQQWERAGL